MFLFTYYACSRCGLLRLLEWRAIKTTLNLFVPTLWLDYLALNL